MYIMIMRMIDLLEDIRDLYLRYIVSRGVEYPNLRDSLRSFDTNHDGLFDSPGEIAALSDFVGIESKRISDLLTPSLDSIYICFVHFCNFQSFSMTERSSMPFFVGCSKMLLALTFCIRFHLLRLVSVSLKVFRNPKLSCNDPKLSGH